MGIKTPFVSEIAKDTYAINEFGLSAMYLIIGEEKALLLDAGCGVCDLAGLVSSLTDKPVMLALTHAHGDHIGGAGAFDNVYVGKGDEWPDDAAPEAVFDAEHMRGYVENLGKQGSYDVYDISPEMVKPWPKTPKAVVLNDGDEIDLGGRKLLCIAVSGHTPGGMCFLDESTRILFSGDACNTNLLTFRNPVHETLAALRYLDTFTGRYDQMWNGHIGYAGKPEALSQPKTTLPDLIHICESILSGEAKPKEFPFLGRVQYAVEYGVSRISYNPENL